MGLFLWPEVGQVRPSERPAPIGLWGERAIILSDYCSVGEGHTNGGQGAPFNQRLYQEHQKSPAWAAQLKWRRLQVARRSVQLRAGGHLAPFAHSHSGSIFVPGGQRADGRARVCVRARECCARAGQVELPASVEQRGRLAVK